MKLNKMKWNQQKIKELMEMHNLRKKDMARNVGVSPQLMSYYLSNPPTVHKAVMVSLSLNVTGQPSIDWRDLIT